LIFYLTLALLYSDRLSCPHTMGKIIANILMQIFVQILLPILMKY